MTTITAPATLLAPRASQRVRTAALVVGFALFTALCAQISFNIPWTPVPVTGQTFAVLLAGASLGSLYGGASQLLYVVLGLAGLPFYADGGRGWETATGATGGYLIGFVLAAALVGALAERRQDRQLLTSLPAMLAGSALIYLIGVPWLAWKLGVDAPKAIEFGFAPFVIGDALKLLAAGVLLPTAWRFARRDSDSID